MTTRSMIASPVGPVPNVTTCPYCKRPLKRFEADLFGKHFSLPCWGSCGCERSKRDTDPPKPKPLTASEKYARAGIGQEYQALRVPCSEYVKAVREGRNVFISGDNGNGKSVLAASIAMSLIDQGASVRFVNAAIEAQAIKNGFGHGGTDSYERMAETPILVLDDLGKGNPTEWESSLWYSVAEARNAARLPTIVTSNYDGGELIGRLTAKGDESTALAIVSRLRGGALTVRMRGRDMRLFDPAECEEIRP